MKSKKIYKIILIIMIFLIYIGIANENYALAGIKEATDFEQISSRYNSFDIIQTIFHSGTYILIIYFIFELIIFINNQNKRKILVFGNIIVIPLCIFIEWMNYYNSDMIFKFFWISIILIINIFIQFKFDRLKNKIKYSIIIILIIVICLIYIISYIIEYNYNLKGNIRIEERCYGHSSFGFKKIIYSKEYNYISVGEDAVSYIITSSDEEGINIKYTSTTYKITGRKGIHATYKTQNEIVEKRLFWDTWYEMFFDTSPDTFSEDATRFFIKFSNNI